MEINKKDVGNRIKNIRKSKGMTLEEFGNLFGASKGNVATWEKGSSLPNNDRLLQISKKADITVNELLYGSSRSYLVSLITDIVEQKYNIPIDNEVAQSLYNRLHFSVTDNPYIYDSETLFREQKKFFDKFLLSAYIFDKWGLIEYSLASLTKVKEEITQNFEASNLKEKEYETKIFEFIINQVDETISVINDKYGKIEDEANSIDFE